MQPLAWEQRKFRTLVRADKNKNKDGLPLPSYSISNQYGFISQDKKFGQDNTYSKADKKNNYIVYPNSFAYNPARINVGSIGYQNLKGPVLVSSLYEIFKTNEQINDLFLQEWFNTKMFFNQIIKYQEGGVRQYYFFDKLQTSEIRLPLNTNEQQGIADLLKKLDNLISLQQRKLDLLKQLKKGLLQKMFVDKNAKQPILRFKGFSGDWEQHKLSKMLQERNEKTTASKEYPLMSFVQGTGVVPKSQRYDREFLVKNSSKKYKKTELGDFIYSSNNLETGSIGFNKTGKAVISPVYSIFKSNNNKESQFIGILSKQKSFINEMLRYRQGVVYGQWKIHESDFLNLQILAPDIQEQERIIKLFNEVDNLISHQRIKLDRLTYLKKFLLQQMFI
ncbi:restriction endonuclease subunit S [Limosilactobacillus pontis]|uniref:Restriction endonuclease subunit S n=2 Tax=Limosilactobacillus pontis TaxID=35787 RepID=A0A2J6NPM5_9LACO|nr:restriction endonuclease subunit S [Limosilactobacillus pontis]PMB83277.1 restriction endonuclease subunit S [Limosilactobacillus pontis]